MTQRDVTHLMELLRETAHCSYISDLHDRQRAGDVLAAVSRIPLDGFPVEAWNDLIRYITMEKARFASPQEAVAHLRAFLADEAGKPD